MLKTFFAGRVGKNAEHRTTQGGTDICSFSVACDTGYGENKSTVWIDVAKFGKGAAGLTRYIRKGDPITVSGDLTTKEHNGKTYLQCRADEIALQGGKSDNRGERRQSYDDPPANGGGGHDDLDDSIPPF